MRTALDLSARCQTFGLHSEISGFGDVDIPDNPLSPDLIHSFKTDFPHNYYYSREFRPWLRNNLQRFDCLVLHGMWFYPIVAASLECRRQGVPYVCFPHGMLDRWAVRKQGLWRYLKKELYLRLLDQQVLRSAKGIFFTTLRELVRSVETCPFPATTAIIVPYGVDHEVIMVDAPGNPGLRIEEGEKVALFLGRVHPKKNVEFLIEAWAAARRDRCWKLVIAGPAERSYEKALKAKAQELGVTDSVCFTGAVSGADKAYLLQRSQWFLLPSRQENFGIAPLEAMHNGCPVAISTEVYIGDYFHEMAVVLPLDKAAWSQFIEGPMLDESLREQIIARDRELLASRFEFNQVCRAWVRSLKRVVERRPAAADGLHTGT